MAEPAMSSENPEQYLNWELADAIAGRPPRTQEYLKVDGRSGLLSGQGSQNIPLLAWAVRLLIDWHRELTPLAAPFAWRDFFAYFRRTWMGTELCSFIYGMWHLVAVAAVARWAHASGDAGLAASADEWLLYHGCLAELSRDDQGRIIWAGMRSAGHAPLPGWREYAQDLALGADTSRWIAAGHAAGLGMRNSWMWEPLQLLAPTLRNAYRPLAGVAGQVGQVPMFGDILNIMPKLGLAAPLRIIRTDRAVGCLLAFNRNPNTPPWGALVSTGGELKCLPEGGGKHIRQKFDTMSCGLTDTAMIIRYNSSLYGNAQLELPGSLLLDLWLGMNGNRTVGGQIPVTQHPEAPAAPPPAANPSSTPASVDIRAERERIAKELRDLQLAWTDRPSRNSVVAALEGAGTPVYGWLADLVERFMIGTGQAQFPVWQQAIADLRALAARTS